MATESPCLLRMGRDQYQGTARLDSEHIDFAGNTTKFRFRFSEIRNPGQSEGELTFNFHGHAVRMDIGQRTEKWLESILHPKTPAEKLGIRPGHVVRFVNFEDAALGVEIGEKKARLLDHDTGDPANVIVLSVDRPAELRQVARLSEELQPDGSIWVMLPKTSKTVTPANVTAAARQAGLSDGKSVSYNDALCAFKLALPMERRASRVVAAATAGRTDASRRTAAAPVRRAAVRR